ncbi:anti-sigma factor [Alteribacillus bidgolensis]|uniref:Anti-sigma-W factor RsiW n=1 Tax=Alteribacillus bidgolensis TaxID=930129 RepID=A0A1G8H621_9BACI|nr:anti-sigma factor [Alteribacillus bidgolensis]SDI01960.1 Putative zinc-finger [Alteribacillus bidgolensis]
MENKCENLSLYIIDELSENEKELFEQHLQTCSHCKKEVDSFKGVWQTLSNDIEEAEVPETLKQEVMEFIFAENETSKQTHTTKDKKHHLLTRIKETLTKNFSPISAGIAILLVIGMIGLFWSNLQLKDTITTLENEEADPAQIITTYALQGEDAAVSANGTAYLIQEGSSTSLVINLNNMPTVKEEEVYQVWLLKNGNRQNAGTLKPNENGNGLITYRLPKNQSFDDIGITLEPTPYNTQPQGQKVLGTS